MPSGSAPLLLIEDDEDSLLLLTEILDGSGFAVRPCHDPLNALRALDDLLPAMILLDWNLPLMSGRSFLDRARERLWQLPPVLVLTGDVRLEAGGDLTRVLYKPFDLDELIGTVFDLIAPEVQPDQRPFRNKSKPRKSSA